MTKFKYVQILLLYILSSHSLADYDSGHAEISLSINNEIYPYKEFATYVLPNEHLGICIMAEGDTADYRITAAAGELDHLDGCRWIWTAPDEPGLTHLYVSDSSTTVMSLNVFVMTPASELVNGRIGGVLIGNYPDPIEDSPIYLRPDGFIQVTEDIIDTAVSPNFVLGQFLTHSDNDYPQYIVLRERLLLKLEALLERLNETGIEAESLAVLSGYMTPAYNESIGGGLHNRHIYGGAATVIIDRDADGRMDDLDGNGTRDRRDGRMLFELIDDLYSEPGREYLSGGLFMYENANGTSVMLDARGFRKRWPNESEAPPLPDNLRPKHKRQF